MKWIPCTVLALAASACLLAHAQAASDWAEYVSADGGFSLHYPAGWNVEESDGGLVMQSPEGDEVALMLTATNVGEATARECAQAICEVLAQQDWRLSPSDWQPAEAEAAIVAFGLAGGIAGAEARGTGLVVVEDDAALWLSYSTTAESYDAARAASIVQGVYRSLADGNGSEPPEVRLRGGKADEVARAFVFVLEFSLGDPLSAAEEEQVISALLEGWRDDDDAIEAYAGYGDVVQTILHADQDALRSLQEDLAAETVAWMEEADPNDPIVQMVRRHREAAQEILVEAPVTLTRQQAGAYAELSAYSLLLQEAPLAGADEVDPQAVAGLVEGVAAAWPELTEAEREQVGSAPAVWMCLRSVLEHGAPEEQAQARGMVASIAGGCASQGGEADPDASRSMAENMVRHQVMLNINQMTFNHYMWTHGFHSTLYGF